MNQWQNKCCSPWQPSPPSSHVHLLKESPVQMEQGISHYFSSCSKDQRFQVPGLVSDPLGGCSSNFSSTTIHSGPGHSYSALLSGPVSGLECDLQQLSGKKHSGSSSQYPSEGGNNMITAVEKGTQIGMPAHLSGITGNDLISVPNFLPFGSSRTKLCSARDVGPALCDGYQATSVNLAKAIRSYIVPSKGDMSFSPRKEFPACGSVSDIFRSTNAQPSQDIASESNSSIFSERPAPAIEYPHVSCLSTTGDLILNSLGFLAVICSCHHLQLSVAKFCEHSGMFDVNPGDAVHMDTGETVAQWRKTHFCNSGIRIPEDHCGWDWPQGFSPNSGMVKHTASMTSFRQSSNLFEVLGLEGMSAGFVQNWNDAASRNLLTGENLPSAVSAIEQMKTAHWSRLELISDELSSSSEKTFHAVSDGQLMESLVPQNGSTMSALNFRRGQSSICHTIPAYCDSTSTRSSLFTSRTFQNLRTSSYKLEEQEEADAKRDTELTLGQPHPRSQKMEHPFSQVIRPMVLAKSGNGTERSTHNNGHGNMIRQRVVVSAADCSCLATTSNFGFRKQIYGSSSFHGSGDLNGNKNCSTADCAYSHSRQSCGSLQDVSHCSKTFSYNETASSTKSNEPPDHNLHQLNRSHVGYGRLSAFEISDDFQTAPSIAIPCMRLHPPRSIMGLSTKQHTDAYFKMQEGQMSSKSCSVVETHVPIIGLSTTEERSHEPSPIRWVAASGVPQKSLQSEEGVNLQPKEMEMKHQPTYNSSLNMEPPLRFGGRENITLSSATKTDHQRYQQNRSCCTPHIGLKSCECQGKTFFSAVTNQKILQSEMCHLTVATQPSEFLSKREMFSDELREIAYRWRTDTADSLKHEKTNDSSGSSVPFVSQLSVDVVNAGSCTLNAEDTSYADNFGSCTLNAEDTSYADNFVVDEGSEIGICCSSDDGCGSKGTSVSFGIKSSSKAVEDEFSCGCLDKLKLRNSSGMKVPLQSAEGLLHACGASFVEPSSKRSHPVLSGTEEKNKLYDHIEGEDVFQETKLKVIAGFLKNSEGKDGKKIENDVTNYVAGEQLQLYQRHSADADKHPELKPLIFVEAPPDWLVSVGNRKRKPVVCGDFGVISTGEVTFTLKKPAKIVPLSEVLKSAKRCTLPESQQKKLSSVKKLKKMNLRVRNKRFKGNFIWNRDGQYETCSDILCNELDSDILIEEGSTCVNKPPTLEKERYDGVNKTSILVSSSAGQKRKGKQICNCSLFELAIEGEKCGSLKCSVAKKSKSSSWSHFRSSRSLQKEIEEHERVLDACCCVCGSSKGTESNCLLECSQCLIQVHQECYGVPKIQKSEWLCRACRTSAIDIVCSICKRPGGPWIQCTVPNCSVRFHLCCAHQKGLLQNEVESVDNGSFGFYATCPLHAMYPQYLSGSNSNFRRLSLAEEQVSACARTEGYKGRKSEGFQHTLHREPTHMGGCLVREEQLNVWLHINRQKPCVEWSSSLSATDVKHDPRKEYARYRKAKGWKNFVVYKSGIHGLGLYTSQFIPRDAMVVEYVGEVVRPRVADKREVEYQSGKKLQYKSACYFFRIDKEHIIDATCRGGIARFVNHSCLPNCIAKIISMRNQQKVLFFAERDIYPGEEITYDYHFNHEDEGKKIPCLCQSKKCRRYLN